jgi:hypothetical protein
MRWNIIVECVGEDSKQSTITLGTFERLAGSTTAENLGSIRRNRSRLRTRLQDTVVKQRLEGPSAGRSPLQEVSVLADRVFTLSALTKMSQGKRVSSWVCLD